MVRLCCFGCSAPRSGPHSWRTAGRPLPHGKAVFEDPGCTPRVATTVESRLPCGGTILACRLIPGRSPQMPQPYATRCILFAQPSAQRADGLGVGGWDQKDAGGIVNSIVGLVSSVRAMGKCSVFLATVPPFCTGPVNGYAIAKGLALGWPRREKAGCLSENKCGR